jgi:hypothetical protein
MFLAAVFIADKVDTAEADNRKRQTKHTVDRSSPQPVDHATSPADREEAEPRPRVGKIVKPAFVLGLLPVCS